MIYTAFLYTLVEEEEMKEGKKGYIFIYFFKTTFYLEFKSVF